MILTKEVIIFWWFILGGIISGCFFDFFRIIRKNRTSSDLAIYMEDIIFWLVIGWGFLWLSNLIDAGQIRLYMFVGMFLGGIVYFLTIGKMMYKVFDMLCRYFISILVHVKKFFGRLINAKKETESV